MAKCYTGSNHIANAEVKLFVMSVQIRIDLICPYCNTEAIWCENKEIYGKNYGKSFMCYLCKPCDAYVGCHNNTRKALGTMANAELRNYRKKAHAVIDPLWRRGNMSRDDMYKKLRKIFHRDIHVGESDIKTCKEIIKFFENPDLLNTQKRG